MNDFMSIGVDRIFPNPKNPRKELGELSELTESIKERGILQPLVVVSRVQYQPNPKNVKKQTYTVICGHRRLAAAKLAKMKEVKCVVSDMSERDQITAMLLENIQRSNLTPLEEADGYQMMLDLGDDYITISKSTGVSESTIRRRVKLLELDREKMEQSLKRQPTLEQYNEVLSLEDKASRDKVLDTLGTSSYNFVIKQEKEKEKSKRDCAELLAEVAQKYEFREQDDLDGLILVKNVSVWSRELPDDDSGAKYYTKPQYGAGYAIYRERTTADNDKTNAEKEYRAAVQQIESEFCSLYEIAYNTRRDFIIALTEQELSKKAEILTRELITILLNPPRYGGVSFDFADLGVALGIDKEQGDDMDDEEFSSEVDERSKGKPHKTQAAIIYAIHNDDDREGYGTSYHRDNDGLDRLYNFLIALGYQMSDAEKDLQSGEHALYKQAAELTDKKKGMS